jgi:hypothetical protein
MFWMKFDLSHSDGEGQLLNIVPGKGDISAWSNEWANSQLETLGLSQGSLRGSNIVLAQQTLSLYTPWRDMGSVGIAQCILNLGTRCRWVVSLTPRPLCRPRQNDTGAHWIGGLRMLQNQCGSRAMKAYGGIEVYIHSCTLLDVVEWTSRPGYFTRWERTSDIH